MSNELTYRHNATGKVLYLTIRDRLCRYWSTVTDGFVSPVVADWADYAIELTETPSGSYLYRGDWPESLTTSDWFIKELYERRGSSPSIDDLLLLLPVVSFWNGSELLPGIAPLIDGLDSEKVLAAVLATAAGKVTVTDNVDGTYTATFKRQDGSTTALSVTYNPATGTRATTAVIP